MSTIEIFLNISLLLAGSVDSTVDHKWGRLTDLVTNSVVQKEIKVNSQQETQLGELVDALRGTPVTHEKEKSKLATILDTDQLNRLEEIYLQVMDGFALDQPEVSVKLSLTETQYEELETARKKNSDDEREMKNVMKRVRFKDKESRSAFIQKYQESANERLIGILTTEQKEQFRKLKGRKVSEPIRER